MVQIDEHVSADVGKFIGNKTTTTDGASRDQLDIHQLVLYGNRKQSFHETDSNDHRLAGISLKQSIHLYNT